MTDTVVMTDEQPKDDSIVPEKKKRNVKAPLGRPSKFTPEAQERILNAIRNGAFLNAAAAYAGIRPSTLHDWWRRGRNSQSGKLREFSDAVEQALAFAEMAAAQTLTSAATGTKDRPGDWKAAVAYLERRFPNRWAKRSDVTVRGTGSNGEIKHHVDGGLTMRVIASNRVDETGRVLGPEELPQLPEHVGPAGLPGVVVEAAVAATLDPADDDGSIEDEVDNDRLSDDIQEAEVV